MATAALLATLLAACDSNGDDPPTTPATVSFPEDPNKAPTVPDPIKPTAFIEKPCTSLTSEQQKKFNLDSGEAESGAGGEACAYHYTNVDRWIRIDYLTGIPGLQSQYDIGPQSGKRREPEVLDNYPAVATYMVDRIAVPSIPPSCYYMVAADILSNIKKNR